MENNRQEKDMALKDMLGAFMCSYAQRDTDMAFPDWLANKLCQELGLEPEAGARLADDIIGAVADYDQTLHALNQAIEAGQSKEEWLSEQLEAVYQDMPLDAAGKALQRMETGLAVSNTQLIGEIDGSAVTELPVAEAEPVEWNKYSVKAKANSIGQQINSMVLCAAANALDKKVNGEQAAMENLIYCIIPPCSKCPYTLGLVRTTVSPCPQCKSDGYRAYEQFKRRTATTGEQQ